MARKLILYIACSLDGYISKPNNNLDFLNRVQKEGEDYGYSKFLSQTDTIIMGRKTYQWVIDEVGEYPNANIETYVITRSKMPDKGNVKFYNKSLSELITSLKNKPGKNIYCDGGSEIVNEILKINLFDELIVSIIPVLLGNGISLFKNGIPEQDLELVSSKNFDTGLVQLHYRFIR